MDLTQVMADVRGYLDKDQIDKIIDNEESPRNKLLLKLLWDTGGRISEVIAMEKNDIDFPMRRITLQNLKRKNKRNATKVVPITKASIEMLREYITNHNVVGRIFNISRSQAFRIVKQSGINVGFDSIGKKKSWLHPHHFRHSLAIHLVKNGMPLPKVQEILGHSNISSTGFYLRFGQREVEEDYHKIMG